MILVALFIFGLIIGSFLNVVILRLPKEHSLSGRSVCPHCGHMLESEDLVPLFSYLFLKGRCRYCKSKISPRYFIIELLTGLLFLFTGLCFFPVSSLGWAILLRALFVVAILIPVFVVDLEHYLILDKVLLFGDIGILGFNLILDLLQKNFSLPTSYLISGLIAAAAIFILFFALWLFSKGRALGFGDVKLVAFLGLALGWPQIWVGLFLSVVMGGMAGTVLLISGKKTLKSRVPFGTFLSLGAFLALFFGNFLLHWYLALLGF
jgi:leader peptidase (prepilin peptidase)/N-methyltransferase